MGWSWAVHDGTFFLPGDRVIGLSRPPFLIRYIHIGDNKVPSAARRRAEGSGLFTFLKRGRCRMRRFRVSGASGRHRKGDILMVMTRRRFVAATLGTVAAGRLARGAQSAGP